jgi:hypothetical protein
MTCNTAVFGELRTINVYVLYAMELPRRNLTIVSAEVAPQFRTGR